jgi:formamidase
MDSTVTLKVEIAGGGELPRGPHFEGPAEVLGLRSERFYATTGLPLKEAGSMPPHLEYLDSPRAAGLENLSNDLGLAARNALLEMIRYLVEERGLTENQAYVLASVAVDLRIGQVVDAPNVSVLAVLPLDVFVE